MKTGLVLVNLGSPQSTSTKDVRRYLREFLMDGRVIDVPFFVRKMIVELFILPSRPKKSAEAYRKIWWEEGSPLVVISERLKDKVAAQLDIPVSLAMRYGKPSIEDALYEMKQKEVEEVLMIPLYPQYAMSTTETVIAEAERLRKERFPQLNITYLPSFYKHQEYINILSAKIQRNLPDDYDVLLFSYHGIPERHIYKTDKAHGTCKIGNCCFQENSPSHDTCYRHQCYKVTELVRSQLDLPKSKVYQTFQSRLGRDPWLQPYTDHFLEAAAEKGKKKIVVVAPAFVADCLETLEELSMEGKEEFLKAGGEHYHYIPCLNDDDDWASLLSKWANEWKAGKS